MTSHIHPQQPTPHSDSMHACKASARERAYTRNVSSSHGVKEEKKNPYLHGEFFNKMISMNFSCSSGFLTNSFMMKLHKILNLFLSSLLRGRC